MSILKKKVSQSGMEHIEADLKKRWLKKQITQEKLPEEMKNLVGKVKMTKEFENWKEYLRVKCTVDENVRTVNLALVSAISLLVSAMVHALSVIGDVSKISAALLGVVMLAGVWTIVFSFAKGYMGGYARKRAFYELLLFYADNKELNEK